MRSAKTGKRIHYVPRENPSVVPFRKAAHFLIQNRSWKLCHGIVLAFNARGEREERVYPWLEKQGMCFDAHLGMLMPMAAFYEMHQIDRSLVSIFNYSQAWEQMKKTRRYSRWEVL